MRHSDKSVLLSRNLETSPWKPRLFTTHILLTIILLTAYCSFSSHGNSLKMTPQRTFSFLLFEYLLAFSLVSFPSSLFSLLSLFSGELEHRYLLAWIHGAPTLCLFRLGHRPYPGTAMADGKHRAPDKR